MEVLAPWDACLSSLGVVCHLHSDVGRVIVIERSDWIQSQVRESVTIWLQARAVAEAA